MVTWRRRESGSSMAAYSFATVDNWILGVEGEGGYGPLCLSLSLYWGSIFRFSIRQRPASHGLSLLLSAREEASSHGSSSKHWRQEFDHIWLLLMRCGKTLVLPQIWIVCPCLCTVGPSLDLQSGSILPHSGLSGLYNANKSSACGPSSKPRRQELDDLQPLVKHWPPPLVG